MIQYFHWYTEGDGKLWESIKPELNKMFDDVVTTEMIWTEEEATMPVVTFAPIEEDEESEESSDDDDDQPDDDDDLPDNDE
jgi:hypothetical protein